MKKSDAAHTTSSLVLAVVGDFRARGLKKTEAIRLAAEPLGLTARRVRAYCYGEVASLPADEYLSVRAQYKAHLDREIDYVETRARHIRARRAALE